MSFNEPIKRTLLQNAMLLNRVIMATRDSKPIVRLVAARLLVNQLQPVNLPAEEQAIQADLLAPVH